MLKMAGEKAGCCCRLLQITLCVMLSVVAAVNAANCPGDLTQNTDNGQATAVVTWGGQSSNYTCNPESGDMFNVGETTVLCTDRDDGSTCTFKVNVTDNESPTISCPQDIASTTDPGKSTSTTAQWTVPLGSDNVAIVSRQCSRVSGTPFKIGINLVTCTVQDAANNVATCTFRVMVTDNEQPSFTKCVDGPIRRTISDFDPLLPAPGLQITWDEPVANDNSGLDVTLSASHQSGARFPLGVTRVVYSATDNSGNVNNNNCWFNIQIIVRPTTRDIMARGITTSCMTVVWLDSTDGPTEEHSIYYTTQSYKKPASVRTIVPPQTGDKWTTYNKHRICDLSPGQLYTVQVSSAKSKKNKTLQQWTKPNPPSQVSKVPGTLTSSSVELTWTPVALKYVEQYLVTFSNGRQLGYFTKTTDRIVVDNLRPRTGYFVRVKAVVGSGDMRLVSQEVSGSFQTAQPKESELIAYNYTESTIQLAWWATVAATAADPFMLFIEPKDAVKSYLTVPSSGYPVTALFEGLRPNTEYHIRLISNLGLSLSTTQKTRPGRVRNIRFLEVMEDSITVGWDPPREGAIDSYEIYRSPGDSTEPTKLTGTSYTFTSLTPRTEYFIRIVSVYDEMESVPETVMATAGVTKAHGYPPTNFVAISIGASLGLACLVILALIIYIFKKHRRPKNKETHVKMVKIPTQPASKSTRRTRPEVDGNSYLGNAGISYEVCEIPTGPGGPVTASAGDQLQSNTHSYENSMIGKRAADPRPKHRWHPVPFPKFASQRKRDAIEDPGLYAKPNING